MGFAAEIADCCGLYFDGEVLAIDVPKSFFAQNNYYTTAAHKIAVFKACDTTCGAKKRP